MAQAAPKFVADCYVETLEVLRNRMDKALADQKRELVIQKTRTSVRESPTSSADDISCL